MQARNGSTRLVVMAAVGVNALCSASSLAAIGHWTYISLQPNDVHNTEGLGVSGGRQVGRIETDAPGLINAVAWSGSGGSMVNLHPAGYTYSVANAVWGTHEFGAVANGININTRRAAMWSGTAGSFVNLHPASASNSQVLDADATYQVGPVTIGGVQHAGLWQGSAASFVDLTPAGANTSSAVGAGGGKQVGTTNINGFLRASLWSGTAASWVDLSGNKTSMGLDTDGVQQVGILQNQAALWSGTAASYVSLKPSVHTADSRANAVAGGIQVGSVDLGRNGLTYASLWMGSAGSWMMLHNILPSQYNYSTAEDIWIDGDTIYVVGQAHNSVDGRSEAMMWVYVPAPSALLLACAAGPVVLRRRR